MNVRTVGASVAALVLAAALTACTQTIDGSPGPRPTVAAGGDFSGGGTPTGEGSATDQPTGETSSASTDGPTDVPTDIPTDVPTDGDSASIATLCSRLDFATQQGDIDPAVVKSYVSTVILVWGIANDDQLPYNKADAATIKECPDVRTAVLAAADLPDLKSSE